MISPEIQRALTRSEPVVGLESSLIAHSLPETSGPEVARECEERVRAGGALPATVAVIDGQIHVGLDEAQIERLSTEPLVRKVGPRDLGSAIVSRMCGATTVAGTMAVCRVAGIHFLSTAGIGGAHRGWATSGDVSADILELGTSPVCVVCSGARSFLDTAATLELLETYGVPVIGYGIDHFPLYYARESDRELVDRADDPRTVATVTAAHWGLSRSSAIVVANAIAPEAAIPADELEPLIEEAMAAATAADVHGIDVTPFVLQRLHLATNGRTLAAHRRLVGDNAELAAQIAAAYYAR